MVSNIIETQIKLFEIMTELVLLEIFFVLSVIVFLIALIVIVPTMIFDRFFANEMSLKSNEKGSNEIAHL